MAMPRFMLFLLFLGGVAMVIAGVAIAIDASTSNYWSEQQSWAYAITGWLLIPLGCLLALGTTLLALFVRPK
jgi:hypothetical protein